MNDVVVSIPAAHFEEKFEGHTIRYDYIPEKQVWHWHFEVPIKCTSEFFGDASDRQSAIKDAHKMITKVGKCL